VGGFEMKMQFGFKMKREKKPGKISIPILPKAQEIIEKYSTESNHAYSIYKQSEIQFISLRSLLT
jgi:hypothetical protein